MPQITQLIQQFTYTGTSLLLSTADFVSRVKTVFRVSPNGKGYVSWEPGAAFPAFSTLEYGVVYTVLSVSVGYLIPDGIVTPTSIGFSDLEPALQALISDKINAVQAGQIAVSKILAAGGTAQLTPWTPAAIASDVVLQLEYDNSATVTVNEKGEVTKLTNQGTFPCWFSTPDPSNPTTLPLLTTTGFQFRNSPLASNVEVPIPDEFAFIAVVQNLDTSALDNENSAQLYNAANRLICGLSENNEYVYLAPSYSSGAPRQKNNAADAFFFSRETATQRLRVCQNDSLDYLNWQDGVPASAVKSALVSLGGQRSSTGQIVNGVVAVVQALYLLQKIDTDTLEKFAGYLRVRFGVSLPADHRYATTNPVVETIETLDADLIAYE